MKFDLEVVKFNADVIVTSAPCDDDNWGECELDLG